MIVALKLKKTKQISYGIFWCNGMKVLLNSVWSMRAKGMFKLHRSLHVVDWLVPAQVLVSVVQSMTFVPTINQTILFSQTIRTHSNDSLSIRTTTWWTNGLFACPPKLSYVFALEWSVRKEKKILVQRYKALRHRCEGR